MTSPTERHRTWQRSWSRTERAVPRDPFAGAVGSSPHARRARRRRRPAPTRSGDHPRIRGEHRGASLVKRVAIGIIPAYAGSTRVSTTPYPDGVESSPHTRGAPKTTRFRIHMTIYCNSATACGHNYESGREAVPRMGLQPNRSTADDSAWSTMPPQQSLPALQNDARMQAALSSLYS